MQLLKPFAIHTNVTYRVPGENYAVRIYLDGHKAAGVVIRPEDFPLLNAASKRVSQTETRSFMFGSLELSGLHLQPEMCCGFLMFAFI
jgi:hypothetical protein